MRSCSIVGSMARATGAPPRRNEEPENQSIEIGRGQTWTNEENGNIPRSSVSYMRNYEERWFRTNNPNPLTPNPYPRAEGATDTSPAGPARPGSYVALPP